MGSWVGPIKFGVKLFKHRIFSTGFDMGKLKINGKIRVIPEGELKLNGGGLIRRNGNKLTFTTNNGEDVDFISYGWFFNAYVRSNIPVITGICSQKFVHSHFFKHEDRGHRITITRPKCPKRALFRKHCQRRGLRGKSVVFCTRDLCAGLPIKIENRLLRRNKREKKVKLIRERVKVQRITCELYADPHVHGFNKQRFEAQTRGDWVLYRGKHLSAHYRGKSMGSWVGPIKFGVKLFNHKIYTHGFDLGTLKIDGEKVSIPAGVTPVGKRGQITRVNNRITISTQNGEEIDIVSYGWFFNAYVRSNVRVITGICSHKFIRSNFFNHPEKGKLEKFKRDVCPRRQFFRAECKGRGLNGEGLRFCVKDLCAGLPKKVEDRLLKRNEIEEHKLIQIKRVHRVQCQLYADPHVYGFNQHSFNAQVEGDWVIYKGLYLSAHYRGKKFGSWVGPVKYGIRIFGQRISSRGFGNVVNIDGNNVNLHAGINHLPKGGIITVANGKTTYSTQDGEEIDFVSGGSYYNVFVRSNVPNVSGLCSQQFVRSNFFSNPSMGQIDHINTTRHCERKEHFKGVCERKGLTGTELRNCISDRCGGFSRKDERKVWRLVHQENRIELPRNMIKRLPIVNAGRWLPKRK